MSATVTGWAALGLSVTDGVLVELATATGVARVPASWSVPQAGTVALAAPITFGPLAAAPGGVLSAPVAAIGLYANQADALPQTAVALAPVTPAPGQFLTVTAAAADALPVTPPAAALTADAAPLTAGGDPLVLA